MQGSNSMDTNIDLFVNQCNDVEAMRASLLSIDRRDPNSARKAMQNITILRVYHQMTRIIRYIDLMNKLEDKMYQSIESQIDSLSPDDEDSWRILLNLQTKLQENMIQSHKLLEPYLNFDSLNTIEIQSSDESGESYTVLNQDSREKLRTSAQQVLEALQIDAKKQSAVDAQSKENKDV